MDLAFTRRIDTELEALVVIDETPTGNPMLGRIMTRIAGHPETTNTQSWIRRLSGEDAAIIPGSDSASAATTRVSATFRTPAG